MRRFFVVVMIVLQVLTLYSSSSAQAPEQILVGFVLDANTLPSASPIDSGAAGLTELTKVFQNLGAELTLITLNEPVPEDVQIVVLAGPEVQLTPIHTANLWSYLQQGKSLLLALDPDGYQNIDTEGSGRGINQLLLSEYGIGVSDTFLNEQWFSVEALVDIRKSQASALPEASVPHPIVEPLLTYELPVETWGARSIVVQPSNSSSYPVPLLYTETAYGEVNGTFINPVDFSPTDEPPLPMEYDIGIDEAGHLFVGAISSNEETGSRVALLGDSEMVQNSFGFLLADRTIPLFPGNVIFLQRVAGWLMGLPEADWGDLPANLTWLDIDGDAADWDTALSTFEDSPGDAQSSSYDIEQVTVFHNNEYIHFLIETQDIPEDDFSLTFSFQPDSEDTVVPVIEIQSDGQITYVDEAGAIPLYNAEMAVGRVIEVRLPLYATTLNPTVQSLCLNASGARNGEGDCTDDVITSTLVTDREPLAVRYLPGPYAALLGRDVNLRSGPGTNYRQMTTGLDARLFAALGRNQAGDWILVQSGRYYGWLAEFLVEVNGEISELPITNLEVPFSP